MSSLNAVVAPDTKIIESGGVTTAGLASSTPLRSRRMLSMVFEDGRQLVIAPESVLETSDGPLRASKLAPGTRVELLATDEFPYEGSYDLRFAHAPAASPFACSLPSSWSPEVAQFLGWLTAVGSFQKLQMVSVYQSDRPDHIEMYEKHREIVAGWYDSPRAAELQRKKVGHFRVTKSGQAQFIFGRAQLMEFLTNLGIPTGVPPHQVRVPSAIYSAPEEIVVGYLRGVFDASVGLNVPALTIQHRSEDFVAGLQSLLDLFGIPTSIETEIPSWNAGQYVTKDGKRRAYSVRPRHYLTVADPQRWGRLVGFSGEREVAPAWTATPTTGAILVRADLCAATPAVTISSPSVNGLRLGLLP